MRLLLRHAGAAAGVALAVATLCFVAVQMTPGDLAFRVAAARYADSLSMRTADALRQAAGLDRPVTEQYIRWIASVVSGDLGRSLVTDRSVADEVVARARLTLSVGALGVTFAFLFASVMGTLAGLKPGGLLDRVVAGVAAILASMPPFLVGVILVTLFAVQLQWLPVAGMGSPAHFVLPTVALGLVLTPGLVRTVRNAVARTREAFFITYAGIKGVRPSRIVLAHALRPTLVPVVAYVGVLGAQVAGGFIVLEVLFNLQGLGHQLVKSLLDADIPMVMGTGLAIGLLVVLVNAATDIAMRVIDPRTAARRADR